MESKIMVFTVEEVVRKRLAQNSPRKRLGNPKFQQMARQEMQGEAPMTVSAER